MTSCTDGFPSSIADEFTLQPSLICVAVLQHVDFIIAEHRQLTAIFAKVGLF